MAASTARTTPAANLKLLMHEVPLRVYPLTQVRQLVVVVMHVIHGDSQAIQVTG